tara:strand:- start:355 stop:810 length:456 start_codon:yes stop_codon:yes gene_type:complete
MPDKVYLPMNPEMRDELRYAMNTQFRYKLYRDPTFPFLHSMGIRHIIQGFEAKEELGFVGVLHLWYENNSGELSYHTKDKHFVAGDWKHEWLDRPEDAIKLAIQIQKNKPYNEDKLIQVAIEYARKAADRHVKKLVEEHLENEEEIPKLLN